MNQYLRARIKKFIKIFDFAFGLKENHDLLLLMHLETLSNRSLNPLNKNASHVFSQLDEDGIISKILFRIKETLPTKPTFLEIGVGDGTENNTLNLIANKWQGLWIGNQELISNVSKSSKILYLKEWVTQENVLSLIENTKYKDFDLISLDIDGNDFYIWEQLLSKYNPKVIVAEYNGKFDSETKWVMSYSASSTWNQDWYFGASFLAFTELFLKFNYRVVACSLNGNNMFLVKSSFVEEFSDIPSDINLIYQPALHMLFKSKRPIGEKLFAHLISQ
jgi:hypothetical protein